MFEWNANQYLKYESQRTQPAIDLANRIRLEHPKKIIDLGCGPGNSTAVLANRFKEAAVLGVDNSEDMIAKAKENYSAPDFAFCDLSGDLSELGGDFDIVFSNACLQWVPDHPALLPKLMKLLADKGILAVQIPYNLSEPIQRIIDETASANEFKAYLTEKRPYHTLTPEEYYDVFAGLSANCDIWQVTYYHEMDSHRDILEWYKGTGMRPYLAKLPEDLRPLFEETVYQRIVQSYPAQKNDKVLFRFPRLFITAWFE